MQIATSSEVMTTISLLHNSDPSRNYETSATLKFDSSNDHGKVITRLFFHQDRLLSKGFIHADGSIRFTFSVKKFNFIKRLKQKDVMIKQADSKLEKT